MVLSWAPLPVVVGRLTPASGRGRREACAAGRGTRSGSHPPRAVREREVGSPGSDACRLVGGRGPWTYR
jgi:hypothetical protein